MEPRNRTASLAGYLFMLLAGISLYAALLVQGGALQAVIALKGIALLALSMVMLSRQTAAVLPVPQRKRR